MPIARRTILKTGLAATLAAPTFSGQFGGSVGNPYNFTITNPNGATGTLYYSVNGADPRDIGGGANAGATTGAAFPKGSYTALNKLPDWGGVWVLQFRRPAPGAPPAPGAS